MSVEAVQSNNTGAYTLGGAALGAIGGGAYGYFSKPYLEKDNLSDTFYRSVAEKALDATEEGKAEKAEIALFETVKNAEDADALAKAKTEADIFEANASLSKLEGEAKAAKLAETQNKLKEAVNKLDEKTYTNKADLLKSVEEAKALEDCKEVRTVVNKAAIESTEGGFEAAKKNIMNSMNKKITLTDKGKNIVGGAFDASKKEFKLDGLAEDVKKPITETISSMKTKAALKWGAIAAVVLGVVGFIVAKCRGKSDKVNG